VLERQEPSEEEAEFVQDTSEEQITLEHVLPQNPNKDWKKLYPRRQDRRPGPRRVADSRAKPEHHLRVIVGLRRPRSRCPQARLRRADPGTHRLAYRG